MKVYAPASTANLGPGFDCLGAALSIGVELELTDDGWRFEHTGPGAPDEEPDGELVQRAIEAASGRRAPGLVMRSAMPVGAGLGSSGCAIAAGLVLGAALSGSDATRDDLLALGTEIEGHPDNVAASLFGGITICVPDGDRWQVLAFEPSASVRPRMVLTGDRLATAEARDVLPGQLDRADAVANIAAASGLVAVLTGAVDPTPERLLACTADLVHEPARAPLMWRTAELQQALRSAGIAAAVSGAGPSIVCLVAAGQDARLREVLAGLDGIQPMELDWDRQGARIVEEGS